MRALKFAIPILLTVAFIPFGGGGRDHVTADGYVPPATPPPELQTQFNELTQELTSFDAQLDSQWNGSVGPGQFAGAIQAAANPNKTVALLGQANWTRITQLLDAFETMGVRTIKIDLNYPVLTPAFHTYLQAHPPAAVPNYTYTAENFIGTPTSFFNKLAAEIRSRGLGLWIEYGELFSDYTPTPPAAYFADMRTAGISATQARYTAERAAESAAIVSQLKPDYYTVLEEPNTQAANFGYFPGNVPIFDPDGWIGFIHAMTAAIVAAAPGSSTQIGAGVGVWDGTTYLTKLAPLADLDYFDIHIYPLASLTTDYLQNTLAWIDYIHSVAPGKFITIGETWSYKTTKAEVSNSLDYQTIFGRDVYSFWEPIDRQYLDVLFKMMHSEGIVGIMPYWAQYYFAYLTYGDPDLDGVGPVQILSVVGAEAQQNWATMTTTETGDKFAELASIPPDADGDGTPDSADTSDTDGDGVSDSADHCPLRYTAFVVPNGDNDCDGFPDTAAASGKGPESFIGTRANDWCANTPAANDEPYADAWPPDFDDNQKATITDVTRFGPVFNIVAPNPLYKARFDLNGDNRITITDVTLFSPFFNKACTS